MAKNVVIAGVAFVAGAFASWLYFWTPKSPPKTPKGHKKVVVAATDLSPGTVLTEKHVLVREVPARCVSRDTVLPQELDSVLENELVFPVEQHRILSWFLLRKPSATPPK
jgi:Flp pilus assembly protein CpaB